MPESITISAPSRLHFGLFSVGDTVERQFGGIGLMIDAPRTVVTATRADSFHVTGLGHEACRQAIDQWFKATRPELKHVVDVERMVELPVRIEIESLPPRHSGFGSGTQLALASAMAVSRLLDLSTPGPLELASTAGRGKRSGIGSHGFFRGGFLVDRGKLPNEPLAPLDFQTEFPEPWSIVTVIHRDAKGLSGETELKAFGRLPKTTESQRESMLEIVRSKIIPGVMQTEYDQFADGVYEFCRRSGMMFAAVQNGPYNGPQIESLVGQIRDFGVQAVGQSSWGPCVFAITRNDEETHRLIMFLESEYGNQCDIRITKADNDGARLSVSDSRKTRTANRH